MKLYESNGKTVNVYELNPKYDLIRNFKFDEMQKIPFDIRILKAITNDKDVLNVQEDMKKINIEELNYSLKNFGILHKYHRLSLHEELNNKEKFLQYIQRINYILTILNNYYQGVYDKEKIVIVNGNNGELPLLVAGNYIYENEHSKKRTNSNIIHLTESLYFFHLLLKEQYSLLEGANVEKILNLFNFNEKPLTYNIDDFKSFEELNFPETVDNFENYILNRANESEKLLHLVRKL